MSLKIDLEGGVRPPPPPEIGTPDNRFVFERKLGQGAEGTVYLAVPSGQISTSGASSSAGSAGGHRESVAVKVVTGRAFERCRATRHLWPSLVHPNVVYPRSAYFDNANSRCFLEMELLASDLLDDIQAKGNLDDAKASKVAGFLAAALDHLHRRGVAHCDVKLENVFIRGTTVKLGDLGGIAQIRHSATTVESTTEDSGAGSPATATSAASAASAATATATKEEPSSAAGASKAPELWGSTLYAPPEYVRGSSPGAARGTSTNRQDLLAGDMWSLGVTLYSAVAGHHPWDVATETCKKFRRFLKNGVAAVMPDSFSPGLKSLLSKLLELDPKQRPTAAQVLTHPWVTTPPASPTMSTAPATMEPPAPVTPTGLETCIFPVTAAPVGASRTPATKSRGRCPISTESRTARVVTAVEAVSYEEVAPARCRKRKEPESEGSRGPFLEDDADAYGSKINVLGSSIDGGSGSEEAPPSKCARVVAPSPLLLPGIAAAPTEAHATLVTTPGSEKKVATRLQEEVVPSEGLILATKCRGRCPNATGGRTAQVVTVAGSESYEEVPHAGCRKRKEPESEGPRSSFFEGDAEACGPEMNAPGGFTDGGGSGGGEAPPSKRARVVSPSPLLLPGIAAAPTEVHATLTTTPRSGKKDPTRLQEDVLLLEAPIPSSET